jgi:aspartyl protease family protein
MMNLKRVLLLIGLSFSVLVFADTRVNVVGLFHNKALLMINGEGPYSIKAGQTINGVKLVSANSNAATLVVEGKRQVLGIGLGPSVGSSNTRTSKAGSNKPVYLYADSRGHFFGNLTINGASLKYLVDSGATTVVMSSEGAKAASIDYKSGNKTKAATANGVVDAYSVSLNKLKIGSIVLYNVQASVIEGASPPFVLLGMSVQNRLKMTRENSTLTLIKKY